MDETIVNMNIRRFAYDENPPGNVCFPFNRTNFVRSYSVSHKSELTKNKNKFSEDLIDLLKLLIVFCLGVFSNIITKRLQYINYYIQSSKANTLALLKYTPFQTISSNFGSKSSTRKSELSSKSNPLDLLVNAPLGNMKNRSHNVRILTSSGHDWKDIFLKQSAALLTPQNRFKLQPKLALFKTQLGIYDIQGLSEPGKNYLFSQLFLYPSFFNFLTLNQLKN